MERVFLWMEARGYPKRGTDWLRRQRLLILITLAILSWVVFMLAIALVVSVFGQIAEMAIDLTTTPKTAAPDVGASPP